MNPPISTPGAPLPPAGSTKFTRGVYLTNQVVGLRPAVDLWAYDSEGYCVAHVTAPNTSLVRASLVIALRALLDDIDPVPVAPVVSERDRLRELLAVSEGGNKPVKGRPRARRPFTVVRGGVSRVRGSV